MRVVLAAAAVAAAFASVPAEAAVIGPVCHVRLVDAVAGASSYCDSGIVGSTNDQTLYPRRVVTIEVATGSVTATLRCWDQGRDQTSVPLTVTAGEVVTISEAALQTCRVTLTADVGGTTATATSSPAKGFNPY